MATRFLPLLFLISTAHAAPPADADPALAPWFKSLQQPGTSAMCCSVSDCRPVRTRYRDGALEAFIGPQFPDSPLDWRPVPPEVVIHGIPNQAGVPVACWYLRQVYCFIDGGSS
jgi:hypothetical protein